MSKRLFVIWSKRFYPSHNANGFYLYVVNNILRYFLHMSIYETKGASFHSDCLHPHLSLIRLRVIIIGGWRGCYI